MTQQNKNSMHQHSKMSNLELIEMELEWQELVDEMDLVKKLGPQGFEFCSGKV